MKQTVLAMDQLRDVVSRRPDDALSEIRNSALANLVDSGLPGVHQEDWKYTSLDSAYEISNQWLTDGGKSAPLSSLPEAVANIVASIDANWLLIVNGHIVLDYFEKCPGLDVATLSESGVTPSTDRPLANLNAALLEDGLRISVHAATEKPLGILITSDASNDTVVAQSYVDIEISAGCDAEIIEYQHSTGALDSYENSSVTLNVGQAARVSYVRIQDRSKHHVQTGLLAATLDADSHTSIATYDLGGGLVRNDLELDLCRPGASLELNGLYLAGEGQHIDNHSRIEHRVGPASSSQEYRGILGAGSRCVWNGKAIVHEGADGTDANQANHNLLLSDKAEIDAKPELEIYADDVKCSHGTTVGQLDENALFYLRTRGIDEQQAAQMMMHAFAADIVSRAPIKATESAIQALVESRLADLIEDRKT